MNESWPNKKAEQLEGKDGEKPWRVINLQTINSQVSQKLKCLPNRISQTIIDIIEIKNSDV